MYVICPQLPSFNELSMVSLLGALMSVAYCTIAVAMAGTVKPAPGTVNYDPANVERTPLDRTMGIFNALTSILFAYGELYVADVQSAVAYVCSASTAGAVPGKWSAFYDAGHVIAAVASEH